jgi:hypothetical protein
MDPYPEVLMECHTCKYPLHLYRYRGILATNSERQSDLFECPECGSYYEIIAESRKIPERLDPATRHERFPDYIPGFRAPSAPKIY